MRHGPTALAILLLALLVGARGSLDSLVCAAVALAGASLAFALVSARPDEASAIRLVLPVVGAGALLTVGLLEPTRQTAGLFHREVRGIVDLIALTPFSARELAGPLAAAALPLCAGLVRRSPRPALLWSLAAALAGLLAAFGGPSAWAAALVGLGWAARHRGGHPRRWAAAGAIVATALLIAAIAFVGLGWHARDSRVRAFALAGGKALQEWSLPAAYVARADFAALAVSPWAGSGLGSFADAYQANRPDSMLAISGVERPPTARNDLLQLAIECGLPAAIIALGAFLLLACRASRTDPYLGGALVTAGVAGALGHAFAPANQIWLWALLGLAARGGTAPPRCSPASRWTSVALLAGAAICLAGAARCGPRAAAPSTRGEMRAAQALARSGPARLAGLARAAEAFATRWEVVEEEPPQLGRAWERARYQRFLVTYAEELRRGGQDQAASAYEALREGLAVQGAARPEPSLTTTTTVLSR